MLRCKDIANALAKENVRDLTWRQRFFLFMHIFLCPVCGRFHRDVVKSHENAREFCEQDEVGDDELPDDAKKRLQDSINNYKP